MINKHNIRTIAFLRPHQLSDVETHIVKYLEKNIDRYSSQEIGIMLEICSLNHIYNNMITNDDHCIGFEIEFTGSAQKPNINEAFNLSIEQVYSVGCILTLSNKIRIFIPEMYFNQYNLVYDHASKSFSGIKQGDYIQGKIIDTRYEKGIFDCIGQLTMWEYENMRI